MAVKRGARGKSERRTAPARGTKARGKLKKRPARRIFRGKARVYHLIDATAFVRTTDKYGEHLGPAKNARTTCCDQPIGKVFGVATSKAAFVPPVTNWCEGAR